MKRVMLTGLGILLSMCSSLAESLFLDESFGLSEKLEVLSYDHESEVAEVKVGDDAGSRLLDSFSDAAQKEILAWNADCEFESGGITVDFAKQSERRMTGFGERADVFYELTLKNKTSVPFAGLKVTCQIFYESIDGEVELCWVRISNDGLDLPSGYKKSIGTKAVTLRDETVERSWYTPEVGSCTEEISQTDQLLGIYVYVERAERSGNMQVLEFSHGKVPRGKKRDLYKPAVFVQESLLHDGDPNDTDLILVEGGSFLMGDSWKIGDDNEHPVHRVTLDGFQIGKYEVSAGDIARVWTWGLQNEKFDIKDIERTSFVLEHPDMREVKCYDLQVKNRAIQTTCMNESAFDAMTWYGAILYCNLRSEMEGLPSCYYYEDDAWLCDFSKDGYRLPTEAEWEYAARGGRQGRGALYSGSDNVEEVAFYRDESIHSRSSPGDKLRSMLHLEMKRGSKAPNELGLFDMSGGVAEWCYDAFDEYEDGPQINPGRQAGKGARAGKRVCRGSVMNNAYLCRVTARVVGEIDDSRPHAAGFRVVRSVVHQ